MLNSSKDPQEEKYQQKIEAILEENHKVILGRSHLLINIIFVLLGAYALIFTAIFFPSSPVSSSSISNNSTVSNLVPLGVTHLTLYLSIAFIVIAFGYLWQALTRGDTNIMEKFEKKDIPIQVTLTQRNVIHCTKDNEEFPFHLKDGKKLVDRNNQLFKSTGVLLTSNDYSIMCIILSLLFFIAFISLIKNAWILFIGFGFVLVILICLIKIVENYLKGREKQL